MSTVIDQRRDYLKNPYFTGHIFSDFSPFYITIAICTVLFISLILLNAVCCLCSKHKSYWRNKHTGNRWIIPIWTTTVHKQPPLDLHELGEGSELRSISHHHHHSADIEREEATPLPLPQQRPQRPQSSRALLQQHRQREEHIEFQKRETVAALALFVIGVIFIILRYGPKLCKLRHHALPDHHEWRSKGYEQQVSYA